MLIAQSAKELSAVKTSIRCAPTNTNRPPEGEIGVDTNEIVARRLNDASEKLSTVIQALQIAVKDRIMVDHQLAAAMEQEEGSRRASLHDKLTTLPNRSLLNDRLEHGIAQAKRHRWMLAVMFVDLDKFKSINDTYGHPVGDAVLQTVAMRLKHNTRDDDTISRFGGDEFLCVLTQLHEISEVSMIAAKILKAIQAPCDMLLEGVASNPCLEASIGISVFPTDGVTAAVLIKRADEAMYKAKENGSGIAFAQ